MWVVVWLVWGVMKQLKWTVIKVDESKQPFDGGKIADSIFLAAQDVGKRLFSTT